MPGRMPDYMLALLYVALISSTMWSCATQRTASQKPDRVQNQYIDEPTPPGPDIQQPENPPQVVEPYRPYPEADTRASGSDPQFKSYYAAANQPRIALYVNRALSGNPSDWVSSSRANISYSEKQTKSSGGATETTTTSGGVSASSQVRDGSGAAPLDTAWVAQLEDAVRTPFLQAGVRVVDRELVVRLAAANEGIPADAEPAVKQLEMQGLQGKADILAQVVISFTGDPDKPYLFRTEAYEIKTGKVLVSTSSARWPASLQAGMSDGGIASLPDARRAGSRIARDLMSGLAGAG